MLFYSLNNRSPKVNFKDATIRGQAPDKGLYFPERIPAIESAFFKRLQSFSDEEIAIRVIQPFVGDTIPEQELIRIVEQTINFSIPLVKISDKIFALELFHGPTLAFKDVGARFMSRCLGYFARERAERVIVLVATSGDTGGAVANGFHNVKGVDVVILYPSGKVSGVQEKQLTTLEGNIHTLEVDGTFDDCQSLVKQAFADVELNSKLYLTSANSINVARWLPQQFYYFFAIKQWMFEQPPVISVPSGNFGNICAGLLAYQSGLPVQHFIAACNTNDVVTTYLKTGNYQPQKAKPTISNAMDVGDPSNFIRILELFLHQLGDLKKILTSVSITDEETKKTILDVYRGSQYVLDPHGSVGFLGLQRYLQNHSDEKGIFLETAHPVKFYDVVEPIIKKEISIPDSIQSILHKEKKSVKMKVEYDSLKEFLFKI